MTTAAPAISRARRFRWPVIIATVLAVQASGIIAMVVVSARDPSFAIESDYYEKALAWDQTVRDRRASAMLGWQHSLEALPTGSGRKVTLSLRDAQGRPLEGAQVRISAYHHARAAEKQSVNLVPVEGGRYTGNITTRPGHWTLDIEINRGPDRMSLSHALEVGAAP